MNKTEKLLTQLTSIKNFINILNKMQNDAELGNDYIQKEVCNRLCRSQTDIGYHFALPGTDKCSEGCIFSITETGTKLDKEFDSITQQLKLIQLLEE